MSWGSSAAPRALGERAPAGVRSTPEELGVEVLQRLGDLGPFGVTVARVVRERGPSMKRIRYP